MHWTLDVVFCEDAARKRNNNAAQNYSILLKIALIPLEKWKSEKQGVARKRFKATWSISTRGVNILKYEFALQYDTGQKHSKFQDTLSIFVI